MKYKKTILFGLVVASLIITHDVAANDIDGPIPEPPVDFLPLGQATDQFVDPSFHVTIRPGLPQIDDSQSVIHPCQAAPSCIVNVPAAPGPIGLIVVGGEWPPPAVVR
jgi:hypothetical protein